jgi:hypothetical protein
MDALKAYLPPGEGLLPYYILIVRSLTDSCPTSNIS